MSTTSNMGNEGENVEVDLKQLLFAIHAKLDTNLKKTDENAEKAEQAESDLRQQLKEQNDKIALLFAKLDGRFKGESSGIKRDGYVELVGDNKEFKVEYDPEIEMLKLKMATLDKEEVSEKVKSGSGALVTKEDLTKEMLNMRAMMEMMEEGGKLEGQLFNPLTMTKENFKGLPSGFKLPKIQKFDGTGDAANFARIYTSSMSRGGADMDNMALLFPEFLEKTAMDWYFTLPKETQISWPLTCRAFQKHFRDNLQFKPTRRDLEQTLQKPGESFTDFSARWRNKLMEIVDRPSPIEQKDILLRCCLHKYEQVLTGPHYDDFSQLCAAGVRLDELFRKNELLENKTQGYNNSHRAKSQGNGASVNFVTGDGQGKGRDAPKSTRVFSDLGGVPLRDIFLTLVEDGKLKPLEGFKPTITDKWAHHKYCEFHQHSGHYTNNCTRLHHVIQDLIDDGKLSLAPNVVNNPLPNNK